MPCPHELGPPATASSRSLALPEGPWTLEPFPRKDALRKPYRRPKLEKPRGLLSEVKQVPHLCETIRSQSPTATGSCPPPNPSRGGGQLQPPKIPRFSFSFSPTSLLLKKNKTQPMLTLDPSFSLQTAPRFLT